MKKSEICKYKFTVKESGTGMCWLMLEPMDCELSIFENSVIGLTLRDGMTMEEAQTLSRQLCHDVTGVSCTKK